MKIKSFTFNPFEENTYVIYDNSNKCIIIDPGCYTEDEKKTLRNFIDNKKLEPVKLINTHCHIDHILGNKFVHEQWGVELYMHRKDVTLLKSSEDIAKMYGFRDYVIYSSEKHFLNEGDRFTFGESHLEILFTPGHSPGHICLYSEDNNLIIAGDLIFHKSIGRTDLAGGDYNTLINSIKNKIFPLSNETQILCGHGPSTNLGYEKEHNPFLI